MPTALFVFLFVLVLCAVAWAVFRHKSKQGNQSAANVGIRVPPGAAVTLRTQGVAVVLLQKIGSSVVQASKRAECVLADDALYCIGEEQPAWGARVRLAKTVKEPGDRFLTEPPSLLAGGSLTFAAHLSPWLIDCLPSLPENGLLLQLDHDAAWHLNVPEAARWYGELVGCFAHASRR